jgi:hypothetical protein
MKKNTSKKLKVKKHGLFNLSPKHTKFVRGGGMVVHGPKKPV